MPVRGMSPETKDPSGGTTGRVKLYGRWGGWALAPDTASLGRDYRSHIHRSPEGYRTFNAPSIFLTFWGVFLTGILARKPLRARLIARRQAWDRHRPAYP